MTTATKNGKTHKPANVKATEAVKAETVKAETKQSAPKLTLDDAVQLRQVVTGGAVAIAKGNPNVALAMIAPSGSLEHSGGVGILRALKDAEGARKLACKPSYEGTDPLADYSRLRTVSALRAAWRRAKVKRLEEDGSDKALAEIARLKARKLDDATAWADDKTLNAELHDLKAKVEKPKATLDDILSSCKALNPSD